MPRKPGFYLPGIPAHILQRGNCRQAVFFSDDDSAAYSRWLHEACLKHGCRLHAFVLMTNHVHLLMMPQSRESISRVIQDTGRYYVNYVNRCYRKSGTLWEGRHKGCPVSGDRYLLSCMRYIELNPVRAGMVAQPTAMPGPVIAVTQWARHAGCRSRTRFISSWVQHRRSGNWPTANFSGRRWIRNWSMVCGQRFRPEPRWETTGSGSKSSNHCSAVLGILVAADR